MPRVPGRGGSQQETDGMLQRGHGEFMTLPPLPPPPPPTGVGTGSSGSTGASRVQKAPDVGAGEAVGGAGPPPLWSSRGNSLFPREQGARG